MFGTIRTQLLAAVRAFLPFDSCTKLGKIFAIASHSGSQ